MLGGILLGLIESLGAGLHRPADQRRIREQLPGRVRLHRAVRGADPAPVRAAGRARGRPGLRQHDRARSRPVESAAAGRPSARPTVGQDRRRGRSAGLAAAGDGSVRGRLGAGALFRGAVCAAGPGSEHRGGFCRTARPGLHRVLRGRRLHLRTARIAALDRAFPGAGACLSQWPAHVDLAGAAARRLAGGLLRHFAGHAGSQIARRLPGDCHARIWRDHPHFPEQPECTVELHQWPGGDHADRPRSHRPFRSVAFDQLAGVARIFPAAVLLPVRRARGPRHRRVRAPAEFASGAGLDGDSRRRGGRPRDGHQRAQRQAAGVLAGCHVRRSRRRPVRGLPGVSCRRNRSR